MYIICLWNLCSFGCGASMRWWEHESGALMNGISALLKETPESSLAPSTTWEHWEDSHLWTRIWAFTRHRIRRPWPWTFQPPELWEINFCCLQATQVFEILLKQTKLRHFPICDIQALTYFKGLLRDFPGGQVAKNPHSWCRGPRLHLLLGN